MRDLNLRERAGLVGAVVLCLAGCAWGWWHGRAPEAASASAMETLPLPPGGIEVAAGGPSETPPAREEEPAASPATPAAKEPKSDLVVVYVTGAVKRPGIYTLKRGDRLYKAIHAAGGFKPNAVTEALNLADFLQDGDQLNVPVRMASSPAISAPARRAASPRPVVSPKAFPPRGRVLGAPPVAPPKAPADARPSASAEGGKAASGPEKLRRPSDGTVDINTADETELTRLPGVGASTAAKIVEYRRTIGRFNSVEQLMDVRGIGEKKLAAMRPFLRLN